MADSEATTNGSVAVLEREEGAAPAPEVLVPGPAVETPEPIEAKEAKEDKKAKKRKKKDEDDDLEREIEFETPFGKIELEFEPTSKKKKKDRERREKAEREAAKAAEKARQQLAEQQSKAARSGGGGGGKLLIVLLVIGLIGATIAVAWWLFARPAEELDEVPEQLRVAPEPEPQGALAKVRARVRDAVRAGKQASSETQREQQARYEQITGRD